VIKETIDTLLIPFQTLIKIITQTFFFYFERDTKINAIKTCQLIPSKTQIPLDFCNITSLKKPSDELDHGNLFFFFYYIYNWDTGFERSVRNIHMSMISLLFDL
jgi:hypothetical protein